MNTAELRRLAEQQLSTDNITNYEIEEMQTAIEKLLGALEMLDRLDASEYARSEHNKTMCIECKDLTAYRQFASRVREILGNELAEELLNELKESK